MDKRDLSAALDANWAQQSIAREHELAETERFEKQIEADKQLEAIRHENKKELAALQSEMEKEKIAMQNPETYKLYLQAKKEEAERLAKKEEAERLAKKEEAERLAKKEEAERLEKNRRRKSKKGIEQIYVILFIICYWLFGVSRNYGLFF